MAKPTKTSAFKTFTPAAETAIDKTTRIVRDIIDGETEKRQAKMARLREIRLERDASARAKPKAKSPAKPRKKSAAAAAKKPD